MNYITTDTHLGHRNIGKYCNRPEDWEEKIITGWERLLKPEDTLIHLGDFCFRNSATWHEWLRQVPGKKILIKGNHDNESKGWYLRKGWDFVYECYSVEYNETNFLLSHRPAERFYNGKKYDFNLHGHCHNGGDEPKDDYHRLLAIELHGYEPLVLENVLEKIIEGKWNVTSKGTC